jgi:hypothetical protein
VEGSETSPQDDAPLEVSDSPDSVVADDVLQGANVCRAAALSTMFGDDPEAVRDLTPELLQLGFAGGLASAELLWTEVDPRETFSDVWGLGDPRDDDTRIRRWEELNEVAWPGAAVAFLVSVLGSRLERESAAAASALWRLIAGIELGRYWPPDRLRDLALRLYPVAAGWPDEEPAPVPWSAGFADGAQALFEGERRSWDPGGWWNAYGQVMSAGGEPDANFYLVSLLARWRLGQALRSPDPVTTSLAAAAFPPTESREPTEPNGGESDGTETERRRPQSGESVLLDAERVSAMIHGTWAWKQDWWRPRPGNFHEFIRRKHRHGLYGRGGRFSWSGEYDDGDRELAARDFGDWVSDLAPAGLGSAFAHSYGGEVAARAVLNGADIAELVLLSVPATRYVRAAAIAPIRVVDIRLWVDPVLGLARTRQRIRRGHNLIPVILPPSLNHGATHEEPVWRQRNIAARGGI